MTTIRPVILCGGSGKRLWPLSRDSYPKQFSHLVHADETMFQASLRRLMQNGGVDPVMVTANDYRFIVGEQTAGVCSAGASIIIEPEGRNTAPAICAAAVRMKDTPDAVMVVSPSDHHIHDEDAFARALAIAVEHAVKGEIVTFGIVPDRPETGYGYIEMKDQIAAVKTATEFVAFLEKPNEVEASKMIAKGNYLWNSGIFVFTVGSILEAFTKYAPEILGQVRMAIASGHDDLDFFRLGADFAAAPNISIDFAIMEHVTGTVVPMDAGWNDMGAWHTVWLESDRDKDGVATRGSATAIDCHDTLLRSEDAKIHVVGLGLRNIAAIAMRDAVLIADMDNAQAVSEAVSLMRAKGIGQADEFPRSVRPWGWFETLRKNGRFRVKSIVVKPGQILSLQSHVHRAEHWVVVEGTARVTLNGEVSMLSENQSIYIPLGAKHRLENPGRMDLHLIEVQTGSYLEEDDITRYEDIYARK